jgi:hypothetical protein
MNNRLSIAWILWIAGLVLIIGSWTGTVPVEVGWVGFGIALVGTLLGNVIPNRSPAAKPDNRPVDESTQS